MPAAVNVLKRDSLLLEFISTRYTGRTVNAECRCPFDRAAIMAVIICGAKFVSHQQKYYKYIK